MTQHVRMTRAERRAETRERLMAAAAEVFAERGIAAAPVELICERAGYTRGAFYSNFESKDELCLALLRQIKDNTFAVLAESLDAPIDHSAEGPVDPVDAVLAAFAASAPMEPHVLLLHQEMELYAQREPGFRAEYRQFLDESHEQIATVVRDALAAHGRRLVVDSTWACSLLEEQFIRSRRDGMIYEDRDGGQQRLRTALTDAVRLISEPVPTEAG